MHKAFVASVVIFCLSASLLVIALFSNFELTNPIFEPQHDNSRYINIIRSLIDFATIFDVIDVWIVFFSGLSSLYTGWRKNQ